MAPIHTERLLLRKIVATDLDDLVALDADKEVMRFISGGVPSTRADYEGGILERMLVWNAPRIGYFAALIDGRFVGWFHLRPSVAEPAWLELGYRLRREVWGRGLATEGARALCRVAFHEHRIGMVDACAIADNLASIAVMRRCGMTRRGSFVHPRAPIEVEHYAADHAAFEVASTR